MSQIYKAAKMYSDDNDRNLVPARTRAPATNTRGITWCVLLQPYIENQHILACPDDPEPSPSAQSVCLPHSYGINYSLAFNSGWGSYPLVASMSQIDRVSDIIEFFELKSTLETMGGSYYSHRTSRIEARHSEMANFAFLDGHVKSMSISSVDDRRWWDPFAPGL